MSRDLTRFGVPAVVAAALLWSTGGALIKLVDLPPLAVAGWRSLIAGLAIMAVKGLPGWPRERLRTATAAVYALTVILFVTATKLTTAANAILLQFTAPVYVALLAPRMVGEPTTRLDWAAVGVVMAGICLFFLDRIDPGTLVGNLCGLASGVTVAVLLLLLRRRRSSRPEVAVVHGNLLAALVCLPWMLSVVPTPRDVLGLVLLGVFQLGLGFYLYAWATQHVGAVTAMLITVLEPLLNPAWTFLVVGERPGPFALIGGTVVMGAVLGRGILRSRSS